MHLRAIDLGRIPYEPAYRAQCEHAEEVLAAREAGAPEVGRVLLLEHDPVITISSRAGAEKNLLATPAALARAGVTIARTDRGGDITYHGPGQLVAYPILDLNLLNLGLHAYMRLLESAVIDACADFGIAAERDPAATGVWARTPGGGSALAKVAAMGVRVRKWVSMHGLALNVSPDLAHFGLIVPCGLAGRPVTSLRDLLGDACPTMDQAKAAVVRALGDRTAEALRRAVDRRAAAG